MERHLSSGMLHSAEASDATLSVTNLSVAFAGREGPIRALRAVDLTVRPGDIVGVVGESGSGKTTLGRAVLGILDGNGRILSGSIRLGDVDLTRCTEREFRYIRGKRIAMVFQNPLSALNPAYTVGWQLKESIFGFRSIPRVDRNSRIASALEGVGLRPEHAESYPHQLSGGMRQRVVVAMALINRPTVVIADEPTTALDVTIQAQVLQLLRTLVSDSGTSLVVITHNLGVVASICERVVVMYAGEVVEQNDIYSLFRSPAHPYTSALLEAIPRVGSRATDLRPIPGAPPSHQPPVGCAFHPRCPHAEDGCKETQPLVVLGGGGLSRCWKAEAL